jgi:histone acetyltransferase (RNA polymerase elongator complex component)
VFLPHLGCPHFCAFCNQRAITQADSMLPTPDRLRQIVDKFMAYPVRRRNRTQIAFFGGNFLGLDPDAIRSLLSAAQQFVKTGAVDGIRFSTRPDTIDNRRLEWIEPYSVQTIELGAQSMQDAVLSQSGRGHSVQDTREAVDLLKRQVYEVGLQLMVGLPGETEAGCFRSAARAADLRPDFVRIYPTVVLAGSRLAAWYKAGEYAPLSLQQCLMQVKQLVLFFARRRIGIARMGLPAFETTGGGEQILAGPYHPAFGHLVHCELFFDMARLLLDSGGVDGSAVIFEVHPRSVSRMRGLHNNNLMCLCRKYDLCDLQTRSNPHLPLDALRRYDTGKILTYADLQCDM